MRPTSPGDGSRSTRSAKLEAALAFRTVCAPSNTEPATAAAVEAAGVIHSDLARGFIRAEVIGYDSLIAAGGLPAARSRGLLRLEGKEYIVQNGDILNIRFSV